MVESGFGLVGQGSGWLWDRVVAQLAAGSLFDRLSVVGLFVSFVGLFVSVVGVVLAVRIHRLQKREAKRDKDDVTERLDRLDTGLERMEALSKDQAGAIRDLNAATEQIGTMLRASHLAAAPNWPTLITIWSCIDHETRDLDVIAKQFYSSPHYDLMDPRSGFDGLTFELLLGEKAITGEAPCERASIVRRLRWIVASFEARPPKSMTPSEAAETIELVGFAALFDVDASCVGRFLGQSLTSEVTDSPRWQSAIDKLRTTSTMIPGANGSPQELRGCYWDRAASALVPGAVGRLSNEVATLALLDLIAEITLDSLRHRQPDDESAVWILLSSEVVFLLHDLAMVGPQDPGLLRTLAKVVECFDSPHFVAERQRMSKADPQMIVLVDQFLKTVGIRVGPRWWTWWW